MTEEELKKENEELKATVDRLRKLLIECRKKQSYQKKRQYELERDYLQYDDDDRR